MGVYKLSWTDPGILDYKVDIGEWLRPVGFERKSVIAGLLITILVSR
jgi:hypothetical protein